MWLFAPASSFLISVAHFSEIFEVSAASFLVAYLISSAFEVAHAPDFVVHFALDHGFGKFFFHIHEHLLLWAQSDNLLLSYSFINLWLWFVFVDLVD